MNNIRRAGFGLWLFALLLFFVAERVVEGPTRTVVLVVAAVFALLTLVGRVTELGLVQGEQRWAVLPSLLGYLAAVAGFAVYPLASNWFIDARGFEVETADSWRAAFTILYLLLIAGGSMAAVLADSSRAFLNRPEMAELRRVRAAALSGLSIVLALGWILGANFVGSEQDELYEFAKTARVKPSDGTRELIDGLSRDVEVVMFFPKANEVLERVRPYYEALEKRNDQLKLTVLDHTVEPKRAKDLGARKNGLVFIVRGEDKQRIDLDTDYSKAKRKLKDLDRKTQEALLKVGRDKQTVYLTVGHGERAASMEDGDDRMPIKGLKEGLKRLNVTTKDLGLKAGLGNQIPDDAGLILILGPNAPFLPEEVDTLRAWWNDGGSLLIALDPETDHGLDELLADIGLAADEGVVCNERFHMKSREGGPSDVAIIFSDRFGSHPTTTVNARLSNRLFAVMFEAGSLRPAPDASDAKTQVLVRPMTGSWRDIDGDRKKGAEEPTDIQGLAYASTLGDGDNESRAVVIGDVDYIGDGLLNAPGNRQFLGDTYGWLAREGDEEPRVFPEDEDPVVRHTRAEDATYFITAVLGVPLAVFGFGVFWVGRRRRQGGRA